MYIHILTFGSEIVSRYPNKCKTQARQYLQRLPICITDSDHDYILDEILYQYQIEYEGNIEIDNTAD